MSGQSREAALKQIMRRRRKADLLALVGDTCRCGAEAVCFVLRVPCPPASRKLLDKGPSDRGLSSRMDLILRSLVGRVPMCRSCQVRSRCRSVAEVGPGTARPARARRAA